MPQCLQPDAVFQCQELDFSMYNGNECKTAIVTGVRTGIGQAVAHALVDDGFMVYGMSRFATEDQYAKVYAGDVATERPWDQIIADSHPPGRTHDIDVLINCAGVDRITGIGRLTENNSEGLEFIRSVMYTNLYGPYVGISKLVEYWDRYPEKSITKIIINVSSNASDRFAMPRHSVYCASKAGVSMLTRCLARDLAPKDIFVAEIKPGVLSHRMGSPIPIDADATYDYPSLPIQRTGKISEIVSAILYLVNDAPMFATGCSIRLAGGQ